MLGRWQQWQITIASRMQTEDSLLFRWVVQILVSVGIVATDVAVQELLSVTVTE